MYNYIWYFTCLIVPMLAVPKVLTLNKTQINLAFHSLNRTYVGCTEGTHAQQNSNKFGISLA